jgi:hypothetical protein
MVISKILLKQKTSEFNNRTNLFSMALLMGKKRMLQRNIATTKSKEISLNGGRLS